MMENPNPFRASRNEKPNILGYHDWMKKTQHEKGISRNDADKLWTVELAKRQQEVIKKLNEGAAHVRRLIETPPAEVQAIAAAAKIEQKTPISLDLPAIMAQVKDLNKQLDKKGTDKTTNAEILQQIISELDPSDYQDLTPEQIKQIVQVKTIAEVVHKAYSVKSPTLGEALDLIGKIKKLEPRLEVIRLKKVAETQEAEIDEPVTWKDPWDREVPKPNFYDAESVSRYVVNLFDYFSKLQPNKDKSQAVSEVNSDLQEIIGKELGIDPWLIKGESKFDGTDESDRDNYDTKPFGKISLMDEVYGKWKGKEDKKYTRFFSVTDFDSSKFIDGYEKLLDFAKENQVPPERQYEVVDFDPINFQIGKRLYEVKLDVSDDDLEKLLNDADRYHKNQTLDLFELEGVEGVIAAMQNTTDEYRNDFGGFLLIKKIKGERILDLGTIQDKRIEDRYGEESMIRGGKKTVIFGTDTRDEYYPRAYLYTEDTEG